MVVCPPPFLPSSNHLKGRSFQEIGKLVLGSKSLGPSYLPHFQPHDRLVIYQTFFYHYLCLIHRTSICKTVIFVREGKVDPMPPPFPNQNDDFRQISQDRDEMLYGSREPFCGGQGEDEKHCLLWCLLFFEKIFSQTKCFYFFSAMVYSVRLSLCLFTVCFYIGNKIFRYFPGSTSVSDPHSFNPDPDTEKK
jgi:hypothetical protein